MKHTRSHSLLWPLTAILAAAACAAARRLQLSTAFEGELGLPIPMAPATLLLLALYLLSAAALLLLARRQAVAPALRAQPELVLYAREDTLFFAGVLLTAFLCLAAAPALFLSGRRQWTAYQALRALGTQGEALSGGNNGLLTMLTAVTAALSFLALLVVAKAALRHTEKGRLAILLPAVNNCLWLMELYRGHAADPVRWDYGPQLVAIAAGVVFYLDWAGLYAGVFRPRRTLWIAGMTVVLSLPALMGKWSVGSALLLTAQTIAALSLLCRAPYNLRYPPEPPAQDDRAEEKLEEETHE